MAQYIDKSALVAEIKRRRKLVSDPILSGNDLMIGERNALFNLLSFIDTLEVIDPYKMWVQYPTVKDAIQVHAETYSFNIESLLFNQLTKEQQALWRKEIEEACISGGYAGYQLAKDPRYKKSLEVKEVDLDKEWKEFLKDGDVGFKEIAKHFFELGIKVAQKGEDV